MAASTINIVSLQKYFLKIKVGSVEHYYLRLCHIYGWIVLTSFFPSMKTLLTSQSWVMMETGTLVVKTFKWGAKPMQTHRLITSDGSGKGLYLICSFSFFLSDKLRHWYVLEISDLKIHLLKSTGGYKIGNWKVISFYFKYILAVQTFYSFI